MSYTRLNPVKDYFKYSGTATVTNSIQTLKDVGTLAGTWVVTAKVANSVSTTVALQCRLSGSSSGVFFNAQKIEQAQQNIVTAIFKDETVHLDSFCPTSNAMSWEIVGVRVA